MKDISFGVIAPRIDYIKSLTEKREKIAKKLQKAKSKLGIISNILPNPLNIIKKKKDKNGEEEMAQENNQNEEAVIVKNHFVKKKICQKNFKGGFA